MAFILEAACGSHVGKVRKTNEDNFFFDGRCLEELNMGLEHPVTMEKGLRGKVFLAVLDGMGGESYGECASYTAAEGLKSAERGLRDLFVPEKRFLEDTVRKLNNAVVAKMKELQTEHMGSTLVMLCFTRNRVYSCNLGDSRAFRLRDGELSQLSRDHVESRPLSGERKPRLSQFLGINPEECLIEPYIAQGELKREDRYLLCSDGVTDLLTEPEITGILLTAESAEECVRKLIDAALEKGGRDNITAIVCRIR